MKIKRFFAADIRQAIKKVREELGADAVILSNRRVEGGVEIVSAVDYDEALLQEFGVADGAANDKSSSATSSTPQPRAEKKPFTPAQFNAKPQPRAQAKIDAYEAQREVDAPKPAAKNPNFWSQDPTLVDMRNELRFLRGLLENQLSGLAWGDLQRRYPFEAELLQKLSKLGLSTSLCQEISGSVRPSSDLERLWRDALGILANKIPVTTDDMLDSGGVVALVGPTGVGKTTTIAKLAARFALRHGSRHVGLITLDNYRVGAYEQLRAYGRILDIPVRVAGSAEELQRTLDDLYDRRLVLIDTAGMSQRDIRLTEQLDILSKEGSMIKTMLVMSTTTRLSSLEEIVGVFEKSRIAACILTKIDETTCLGSALSAVIQHSLPIAFVSDGQRVPEDLHTARAHMLVERAVSLMQENEKLLEDELLTYKAGRAVADARV